MSASVLVNALGTEVQNVDNEPAACQAWANAYGTYAADATANGVPLSGAAITLAKAAMQSALVGMSAPSAFAVKLQAGVVAFWASVVSGLAASFTGAIAIVPPTGITVIAVNAPAVFAANTAPGVTKTQALTNIGNPLHLLTISGGTATFPPAIVSPII